MGPIRIALHRHIITLIFEVLYILLCLLCSLPGIVYSNHNDSFLTLFVVYCLLVFGLYVYFAIKKNRWFFPVNINISGDSIDIECRPFFLFCKRYCWQKKDVTIIRYSEVLKFSSLTISNNNRHICISFESLAIKKELMNRIISDLRNKGYDIVSKGIFD